MSDLTKLSGKDLLQKLAQNIYEEKYDKELRNEVLCRLSSRDQIRREALEEAAKHFENTKMFSVKESWIADELRALAERTTKEGGK